MPLLFLIELFDFAGLECVEGCCSDTSYMLSSGREGATPLIVEMGGGGGDLRHYCIQESALWDGDSVVVTW